MSVPEAFFFADELFGVWRGVSGAKVAWVLAPPFGEEEKSARRVLTEIALAFQARGEASLIFSFRGTGDSGGDFALATLEQWREDLTKAIEEVRRRAPDAQIALLGVRLGASLSLQVAAKRDEVRQLILIEPLLSGRSFLAQQLMRSKIRAQMTGESSNAEVANRNAEIQDLDGWPLGLRLKADLGSLDLMRESFELNVETRIVQVGPKAEVAAGLRTFSEKLKARVDVVVMPPFWNLIDYADPAPLLKSLA